MTEEKGLGLLSLLAKGLVAHDTLRTATSLGDRASYVGMSDIAKAYECMRAAVLNKVQGKRSVSVEEIDSFHRANDATSIHAHLGKMLTLQRGHWQEPGIQAAFTALKQNVMPQLEIKVRARGNVPILAHLDFVLVYGGSTPAIRVIEAKSFGSGIPKDLYPSYEMQIYGQTGLLHAMWNLPSFAIRSEDGTLLFEKMTFPELAKAMFNVDLPTDVGQVSIEGWVLGITSNGAATFGPYEPNKAALVTALNLAEELWAKSAQLQAGDLTEELDWRRGTYALCDYCDHASSCPKFVAVLDMPEYESELERLAELKAYIKTAKEESDRIEYSLKKSYENTGLKGEWVSCGSQTFRSSTVKGRSSFDKEMLKALLKERHALDHEVIDALFDEAITFGEASVRLYTKARKAEAPRKQKQAA